MISLLLIFNLFITFSAQMTEIEKNVTGKVVTNFKNNANKESEYKVVPVKHNFNNNTLGKLEIKVKLDKKTAVIQLQLVQGLFFNKNTKIWRLKKDPIYINKMQYVLEENVMNKLNINFYHDIKTLSSIIRIVDKNGSELFQGIIDSDKVLQPLANICKYQSKMFFKNGTNHQFKNSNQYIVHELNFYKSSKKNITGKVQNNFVSVETENIKQGMKKSKLGSPDIVYPEIMVVLDRKLFSYFDYNVEKALYYVLSYWNAVDLLFRRLENPKVHLNIGGIILAEEKLPFIGKNLFVDDTLFAFTQFLFNQDQIKFKKDYDAAMLMTGHTIKNSDNNKIKGKAYVGTACWQSISRKRIMATSVVTHKKLYNSIISTVHELAHLFGVPHDGSSTQSYLGGPGGKDCFFDDGFIMSHRRFNKNQFEFSKCSIKSMLFFFSRKNAECLRNKPSDKSVW